MLQERFGLTSEQLHWRRWRIDQPDIGGDLRKFHQEFPAYPEQAFISTGSHVFDQRRVQMFVDRCSRSPTRGRRIEGPKLPHPAERCAEGPARHGRGPDRREVDRRQGEPGARTTRTGGSGSNRTGGRPLHRRLRPSEGEEIERGESDFTASRSSTTSPASRSPSTAHGSTRTLSATQVYLAALHWNHALIVVEKTGGYGTAMLRRIYFDYKYPRPLVYFRRSHDSSRDREEDRLGWSTDRATKPILVTTGCRCSARRPTRAGTWTSSGPACWRRR
jgi:hypothetical protein